MNVFNVISAWYTLPPKKEEPKEAKEPDRCEHCTTKIEEGDHYYAGYDVNDIYAETCTYHKCTQWFKHKVRVKKGYKP